MKPRCSRIVEIAHLLSQCDDTACITFLKVLKEQLDQKSIGALIGSIIIQIQSRISNQVLSNLLEHCKTISNPQIHQNNVNNGQTFADNLKSLPTDIFDFLGQFLSKWDAIHLGLVDHDLLQLTQSPKFLSNNNFGHRLILSRKHIEEINKENIDIYHWCINCKTVEFCVNSKMEDYTPTSLFDSTYNSEMQSIVDKMNINSQYRNENWMDVLFDSVNNLRINCRGELVSFIPTEKLFCVNKRGQEKQALNVYFRNVYHGYFWEFAHQFQEFSNNFHDKARKINRVEIIGQSAAGAAPKASIFGCHELYSIDFESCCYDTDCGRVEFGSLDELRAEFHENMNKLGILSINITEMVFYQVYSVILQLAEEKENCFDFMFNLTQVLSKHGKNELMWDDEYIDILNSDVDVESVNMDSLSRNDAKVLLERYGFLRQERNDRAANMRKAFDGLWNVFGAFLIDTIHELKILHNDDGDTDGIHKKSNKNQNKSKDKNKKTNENSIEDGSESTSDSDSISISSDSSSSSSITSDSDDSDFDINGDINTDFTILDLCDICNVKHLVLMDRRCKLSDKLAAISVSLSGIELPSIRSPQHCMQEFNHLLLSRFKLYLLNWRKTVETIELHIGLFDQKWYKSNDGVTFNTDDNVITDINIWTREYLIMMKNIFSKFDKLSKLDIRLYFDLNTKTENVIQDRKMRTCTHGPVTRTYTKTTQENLIKKINKIDRAAIIFQLLKNLRHWRKVCSKMYQSHQHQNGQGFDVQGFFQSRPQFEISHTIIFGKIVGKTDNSQRAQEKYDCKTSTNIEHFIQSYSDSVDDCFSAVSKFVAAPHNFDMWNRSFNVKCSCLFVSR